MDTLTGKSFRDMAVRAAQERRSATVAKEEKVHTGTDALNGTSIDDNGVNMKVSKEYNHSSEAGTDSETSPHNVSRVTSSKLAIEGAAPRARVRRVIRSLREELPKLTWTAVQKI